MKGKGNKNKKSNIAAFLKKNGFSLFMVMISLFSLVSMTTAWLNRTELEKDSAKGKGLQYRSNLTILSNDFSVTTYYLDTDKTWNQITTDYERNDDTTKDWTQIWDENSGILVPGKRTEFRTIITNRTANDINASIYITDASVENLLVGKVRFGAYDPDVVVYESADESIFTPITADGRSWVRSGVLKLASNVHVASGKAVAVCWYAALSTDVDGGSFPALTDKASGNFISETKGTNTYYYFVNKTDEDGNPTEAFKCDDEGTLESSGNKLIEYRAEDIEKAKTDGRTINVYADTACEDLTYGDVAANVRISGLYIAVG